MPFQVEIMPVFSSFTPQRISFQFGESDLSEMGKMLHSCRPRKEINLHRFIKLLFVGKRDARGEFNVPTEMVLSVSQSNIYNCWGFRNRFNLISVTPYSEIVHHSFKELPLVYLPVEQWSTEMKGNSQQMSVLSYFVV